MKVKAKFSQEYLLAESVQTEFENQRWLEVQRRAALESHSGHAFKSERSRRSASRWLSRRGCYVTVTFPETDLVPDILKGQDDVDPPEPVACAVTQKPARYKDPLTGLPYADKAAFAALRGSRHLPTNTIADWPERTFSELDLPIKSPIIPILRARPR